MSIACNKVDDRKCVKGNPGFDNCIHEKADVKFNDQEIIDYFFSAREGSWWAYRTEVIDPIFGDTLDIYDTLHLRYFNHFLETTETYSREMYSTSYYFNNNFLTGGLNIEE